jgi:hypothetical protein
MEDAIAPSFYEGIARELLGKLRRLSAFTGHTGSVGAHHEEIVREAIRPMFSERFSVRSGFVFAKTGVVSAQGDILVIDEADPAPYFFKMGNLVVVHPRAVALVVEVKTRLSKSEFHGALRSLRTFRDVARQVSPPAVFPTALFAFESPRLDPDTLDDWYKTVDVPDDVTSYPQFIHVLREGTLDLRIEAGVCGHRLLMGEEGDEAKARSLSVFLAFTRKAAEMKAGLEANPFAHADLRDLKWSKQWLRLGRGFVEKA